jgi:aminoglycoside phosphotransferase (APT) family kinase protein
MSGVDDVSVRLLEKPETTGFSSETLLFDASWREGARTEVRQFVARVRPTAYSLYQEHDLTAQWRVMDTLNRCTDLPVPGIIGGDDGETSVLGQPFFVMERVEGRAPPDSPPFTIKGWVAEANVQQREMLHREGLALLARLHLVDWRALGLSFLADGTANPAGVRRALAHDAGFFTWVAAGRRLPIFEEALSWMAAHTPEERPPVLSWGDARLGNMLFRDFRPVAILDWEMVTLAAPEADLGWWIVFDRLHSDGIGRPRPAGFLDEATTVSWYEQLTKQPVRDLGFYKVRAAFRAGLLLRRYTDALVANGTVAPDAPRGPYTPAVNVLADLLSH